MPIPKAKNAEQAAIMFVRGVRAADSASQAARAGRCGEAIDDFEFAVAAHTHGMEQGLPEVYQGGDLDRASRRSWMAMGGAKLALKEHCLVNDVGRGLHGARGRRRGRK